MFSAQKNIHKNAKDLTPLAAQNELRPKFVRKVLEEYKNTE